MPIKDVKARRLYERNRMRAKRKQEAYKIDSRFCKFDDCTVKLSRYNNTDYCSIHERQYNKTCPVHKMTCL